MGSGPDRGRSPVEWGDFPYVRPSIRPSVRLSWLAGPQPGWLGLRPGWLAQRGGRTDGRTNERTENLPILQDFVPYRGRCPKSGYRLTDRPTDRLTNGPTDGLTDPLIEMRGRM